MNITLIRHGQTAGNKAGIYQGGIDADIIERAIPDEALKRYPPADAVYSSPMRRCLSTAKMIYPGRDPVIVEGLSECRFGDFEGKTADELMGHPLFRQWLETGALEVFPNGESLVGFAERCWAAFHDIARMAAAGGYRNVSVIAHGGVIGAITHRLLHGENGLFRRVVGNLDGVTFAYDAENGVASEMRLLSNGELWAP